jgi:DNA-binding MarR family transcriptional regulator
VFIVYDILFFDKINYICKNFQNYREMELLVAVAQSVDRVKTIGGLMNSIAVLRRESLQLLDNIPDAPAHAQRELIGILMRNPKGVNVKDIAKIAKITSSAATQRVESLEKLGLVRRHVSPVDNRYAVVTFTPYGQKEAGKSLTKFARSLDASCLHLLSDEELKSLGSLLGKVAHFLEPA